VARLSPDVLASEADLVSLRRAIHEDPELAFAEHVISDRIVRNVVPQ